MGFNLIVAYKIKKGVISSNALPEDAFVILIYLPTPLWCKFKLIKTYDGLVSINQKVKIII